jgi:hypothetical protein
MARDYGRSIPILHRHLSISSSDRPTWSEKENIKILIPLLFTGAFDGDKVGDRDIIESLSGMTYEDYIASLTQLLSIDDSPIRNIGKVWMLKAPLDAWYFLATNITTAHLKKFEETVV